jgi:hypothetical protein
VNGIGRFGTAAFREQVRADAAEEPFVDGPSTPRNIQVRYYIREL